MKKSSFEKKMGETLGVTPGCGDDDKGSRGVINATTTTR